MKPAHAPSVSLASIERSFTSGAIAARVLKGITLEIWPGEMTLIVGPSGSGKSTLLAIASGLMRPSAGRVVTLGVDLGIARTVPGKAQLAEVGPFDQDAAGPQQGAA